MNERQSALAGNYIAIATLLEDDMIRDEDIENCIKTNNKFYDKLDKETKTMCDMIMTEDRGDIC